MFDNFLEAEEFIKLKQIRMVDLKFCDLWISKKMNEFKEMNIHPHPYEIETYYDF